ncbi:hypothetical protein DL98DRAFT_514061 [Cadophora sp. DSE1049]|nr:hypothetical protein DL98DRAFT_514061 [Cadophora sp. DSE1049]
MAVDKGWIWFPVLLSFFMNLQSLTTSIYVNLATRRESLSPTMRHHMPMVRSIADVSNLVYVDIILDDPLSHPIPWNSPTIISIFRLPRIQTIRMSVGTGNDAYDWPSDLLAPTLTKLYFFHSNLYEDSLKCILASAPNLYDFTLNLVWYDEPTSNLAGGFLDCRKIGEAITTSTCSATLGRVILDVKFEDRHFNTPAKIERDGKMGGPWESGRSPYPGPTFQWGTKGTLGSIKSLRCLTLLMTDLNLQFGWSPKHARHPRDLLPESLRGLVLGTRLAECREFAWKRDVIREWLKEDISLGQLGALERLVVRQSDVQMEPDSVAKEAVFASFCEEKGITFGIEAW